MEAASNCAAARKAVVKGWAAAGSEWGFAAVRSGVRPRLVECLLLPRSSGGGELGLWAGQWWCRARRARGFARSIGHSVWLVEKSSCRDNAWCSAAVFGGVGVIMGPANAADLKNPRYRSLRWTENWVCDKMATERTEFWKWRDNKGRTYLIIYRCFLLSWLVNGVITNDELAVLIIRACSSRNLFMKHHLS